MVSSTSFLIFGSLWYAGFAITPNDLGLRLQTGLLLAILPAIFLLVALWRPKIGGFIAVVISIPALFGWLMHLFGGDSDPRFIWSLFIITAIYLTGAILATGNIFSENW